MRRVACAALLLGACSRPASGPVSKAPAAEASTRPILVVPIPVPQECPEMTCPECEEWREQEQDPNPDLYDPWPPNGVPQ